VVILLAAVAVFALAETDGGLRRSASSHRAAANMREHPPRPHRRPKPRIVHGPHHDPVPILMYHVIAPPPVGAPFPELYVPQPEFAAQMRALYDAGWTAVTMDELWAAWHGGPRLPAGHPVVISFDNGYRSQFTAALPVLRHLHWVGVENLQLTGLPRSQGGLTPHAIRRLLEAGWELDTQGYSHADLVAIDDAKLTHEVITSRRLIQRRWHVAANWFCYPSGHYDARVVAAVRRAGYRGSTTVVPGWARSSDDPYRLARLRVLGGTSPAGLLGLIAGTRHDAAAPPTYGTG
jgi:peptidoglycan/xylan/chitin deacetylase (PgdA/CDA1 family)